MRVTGGILKGRHLAALKGLRIRPSSDLIRQVIFNLIGQDMTGLRVLDLFAGTGSLGIEAISRGAEWAVFVDQSRQSIALIEKNLRLCGCRDCAVLLRKDLRRGLPSESAGLKGPFDVVFMDPPYGKRMIPPLLEELCRREVLAAAPLVVAEALKSDALPPDAGKLRLARSRIHGETKIAIYSGGEVQ